MIRKSRHKNYNPPANDKLNLGVSAGGHLLLSIVTPCPSSFGGGILYARGSDFVIYMVLFGTFKCSSHTADE